MDSQLEIYYLLSSDECTVTCLLGCIVPSGWCSWILDCLSLYPATEDYVWTELCYPHSSETALLTTLVVSSTPVDPVGGLAVGLDSGAADHDVTLV